MGAVGSELVFVSNEVGIKLDTAEVDESDVEIGTIGGTLLLNVEEACGGTAEVFVVEGAAVEREARPVDAMVEEIEDGWTDDSAWLGEEGDDGESGEDGESIPSDSSPLLSDSLSWRMWILNESAIAWPRRYPRLMVSGV